MLHETPAVRWSHLNLCSLPKVVKCLNDVEYRARSLAVSKYSEVACSLHWSEGDYWFKSKCFHLETLELGGKKWWSKGCKFLAHRYSPISEWVGSPCEKPESQDRSSVRPQTPSSFWLDQHASATPTYFLPCPAVQTPHSGNSMCEADGHYDWNSATQTVRSFS